MKTQETDIINNNISLRSYSLAAAPSDLFRSDELNEKSSSD